MSTRMIFVMPFMFFFDLLWMLLWFPTVILGWAFELPFMFVQIPVNFIFEALYYVTNFKFDWLHLGIWR